MGWFGVWLCQVTCSPARDIWLQHHDGTSVSLASTLGMPPANLQCHSMPGDTSQAENLHVYLVSACIELRGNSGFWEEGVACTPLTVLPHYLQDHLCFCPPTPWFPILRVLLPTVFHFFPNCGVWLAKQLGPFLSVCKFFFNAKDLLGCPVLLQARHWWCSAVTMISSLSLHWYLAALHHWSLGRALQLVGSAVLLMI